MNVKRLSTMSGRAALASKMFSFGRALKLRPRWKISSLLVEIGPLAGKSLLDIGSGLGESSVYFALQGAKVTIVDISPEMVATAQSLGRKFGVELQGIVSGAEDLNLPAESYDLIYIANTIHHIHDQSFVIRTDEQRA